MPFWLHFLSVASLAAAGICSLIIALDVVKHRQHMKIMNLVWPITALYSGPLGLWAYYRLGRLSTRESVHRAKELGQPPPGKNRPIWQSTFLGATHCGSGCTLGDIWAEWAVFFFPITLFGKTIFGAWALDFVLAFVIGVLFQYWTIKPMRDITVGRGIVEALKADFLSLTSWQIGMYGWMAIVTFGLFGHEIEKTSPLFWFMMQIAMLFGLMTSYPVNWWLLRKGIKERM